MAKDCHKVQVSSKINKKDKKKEAMFQNACYG
jgi:hypothetical protein